MAQTKDTAGVIAPPPLIFGGSFLIGWAVNWFFALPSSNLGSFENFRRCFDSFCAWDNFDRVSADAEKENGDRAMGTDNRDRI